MPAPPKKSEKKAEFLKRCIPFLIKEGKESKQAAAICISMFEHRSKANLSTDWDDLEKEPVIFIP